MTARPPVSIVFLNYNHGRFLSESLAAISSQLQPDDELLAFDDASTDDSLNIYRRYLSLTPQMRLIAKDKNQGVIACMNEGLATASHAYIYFAAADDRVEPYFIETMLSLLAKHPEAGLGTCRTQLLAPTGDNLGILPTPIVRTVPAYLTRADVAKALLNDDNWLVGISTIYRRTALVAAGGFLPELESLCDGFVSRVIALRYGCCFSLAVLTSWRRLPEGYSSSQATDFKKVRKIASVATELMRTNFADAFPPAYVRRWHGRWLFGARYYELVRRQKAKTQSGKRPGLLCTCFMQFEKLAMAAYLFLTLRPMDTIAVLRRRLLYLFNHDA